MKNKSNLSFILFLIPFLTICTVLVNISGAFCKWSPKNTAINTYSNHSPVIIIDAGHGGEDGGAVSKNGVYEKDINLSISKQLCDIFSVSGYKVVMTRETDTMLYNKKDDYKGRKKALDLAARVKIASQYEDAIFISIHMNAFPDPKYSGLQVYYSKNHSDSEKIASLVQDGVRINLQPENNRQIKSAGTDIFVLDRITLPAVLIECGFLSNEEEARLLSDVEYQKRLTLSIFLSVSKYIEEAT